MHLPIVLVDREPVNKWGAGASETEITVCKNYIRDEYEYHTFTNLLTQERKKYRPPTRSAVKVMQ